MRDADSRNMQGLHQQVGRTGSIPFSATMADLNRLPFVRAAPRNACRR